MDNFNFLKCKLVNTWGIMYNCDIYNPDENNISGKDYLSNIDWDNIKSGTKLYIGLPYLRYFIDDFLYKLKNPIFLISGHGDEDASCFKELTENPLIIHWFSQNYIGNHTKISQIPIGLDYHTLAKSNHEWGEMIGAEGQEEKLIESANKDRKEGR
jgi:hypothetical protein